MVIDYDYYHYTVHAPPLMCAYVDTLDYWYKKVKGNELTKWFELGILLNIYFVTWKHLEKLKHTIVNCIVAVNKNVPMFLFSPLLPSLCNNKIICETHYSQITNTFPNSIKRNFWQFKTNWPQPVVRGFVWRLATLATLLQ